MRKIIEEGNRKERRERASKLEGEWTKRKAEFEKVEQKSETGETAEIIVKEPALRKVSPGIAKIRSIFESGTEVKEARETESISKVRVIRDTFESMMDRGRRQETEKLEKERELKKAKRKMQRENLQDRYRKESESDRMGQKVGVAIVTHSNKRKLEGNREVGGWSEIIRGGKIPYPGRGSMSSFCTSKNHQE